MILHNTEIPHLNDTVRKWAQLTRQKLVMKLATMSFKERLVLDNELRLRKRTNLKSKTKIEDALATSVLFNFPYQGFFVEHGTRKGVKKGSAEANPRPWLSAVIPLAVEELADQVVNHFGDITIAEIQSSLND